MKKNLFTLVELGVVLGGTAIVMSLIGATVADMKNDAKVIACAGVMKGIEEKTTKFENDNGGTLMSANKKGKLWGAQLVAGKYFGGSKAFWDKNGMQPKNFECPAETRQRTNGGSINYPHPVAGSATAYDYALNYHVHKKITKDTDKNAVRAKINQPARLIRMTEAVKFAVTATPSDVTDRHGDGAGNIVYQDGHIAFVEEIPYRDCKNFKPLSWVR